MNKTINKQVDFDKLLPDFRRISITEARQRKLKADGINSQERWANVYNDGKHLYTTDSHRAIRFNLEYVSDLPSGEPFNYGLHDGKLGEANYPPMERLFPQDFATEFELPYARLKELRDALGRVHKDVYGRRVKNNAVKLEIRDGDMTIKARGVGANDFGHAETIEGIAGGAASSASLWINSKYLSDALLTVSKHRALSGDNSFYFRYESAVRPLVLTDGETYELLLLPIRPS